MSEATITESKNSWALLAGIVDRPSASLAEITAHPRWRWVLPVTLAILATVASAIVTAPYLAAEAKLQMAAVLNRMPAEQLAQMPKQMATLQTPLFVGASAALTGILVLLIGYLLPGGRTLFRLAHRRRRNRLRTAHRCNPLDRTPLRVGIGRADRLRCRERTPGYQPGAVVPCLDRQPDRRRGQPGLCRAGHAHLVLVVASAAGLQAPPGGAAVGRWRCTCHDTAVRGPERRPASRLRRT